MRQPVTARRLASSLKTLAEDELATESTFPGVEAVEETFQRLSRPATHERVGSSPWIPGDFARLGEDWWLHHIKWYVVVDDIEGEASSLAVSAWPYLDSRRRLSFNSDQKLGVSVLTDVLASFLSMLRTSVVFTSDYAALASPIAGEDVELRIRRPRIGDTFAFSDSALRELRAAGTDPIAETLGAFDVSVVVLDVTAAAREQAKIAFYAAASGSLDPSREEDFDLAETIWAERAALADRQGPEQYA